MLVLCTCQSFESKEKHTNVLVRLLYQLFSNTRVLNSRVGAHDVRFSKIRGWRSIMLWINYRIDALCLGFIAFLFTITLGVLFTLVSPLFYPLCASSLLKRTFVRLKNESNRKRFCFGLIWIICSE